MPGGSRMTTEITSTNEQCPQCRRDFLELHVHKIYGHGSTAPRRVLKSLECPRVKCSYREPVV